MNEMERLLASIEKLPPFPLVARKALKILGDPEASVESVIAVIQYDQSITANVLKLCNSAYYGLNRKVHSIREGLLILGNNRLKEIVVASSLIQYYEKESKGYDLVRGDLWRHSFCAAVISQMLSRTMRRADPEALFTTSLLHDIGKVILSDFVGEKFSRIITLVKTRGYSFPEAEKATIGMDHAEVGARIADMWNFPNEMVQSIRLHHNPEASAEDDHLTPMVYLANVITLLLGIGAGGSGLYMRGRDQVMRRYGLKEKDLERLMAEFHEELVKVEDVLGMASTPT